jgi:GT2 family glycosyltransferase/SAM-dependent methyltransferase/glycosyltransferase involved in cell wall biosynthesis
MEFTGERYLTNSTDPEISLEHWHRYAFASDYVKAKTVLDVACGEGYGANLLAETAASVVAIDVDHATIDYNSSSYLRDNLKFKHADMGTLREHFVSQSFDVIVCFEALEHVPSDVQRRFVDAARDLLRPDGILLVSSPNPVAYNEHRHEPNPFHVRELPLSEFEELLSASFARVEIFGQRIYSGSYLWPRKKVTPSVLREGQLHLTATGFRPLREPLQAHYFIAACSNGADVSPHTSFFIDGSHRLVRLRNEMIDGLQEEVGSLKSKLQESESQIREAESRTQDAEARAREATAEREAVEALRNLHSASLHMGNGHAAVASAPVAAQRQAVASHLASIDWGHSSRVLANSLLSELDSFERSTSWRLAKRLHNLGGRSGLSLQGVRDAVRSLATDNSRSLPDMTRLVEGLNHDLTVLRQARFLTLAQWCVSSARIASGRPLFPSSLDAMTAGVGQLRGYLELAKAASSLPLVATSWYPLTIPQSDEPSVSVIIPAFNNSLHTFTCLRSIAEVVEPFPFEVIVVDDASSDDTAAMLAVCEGVRVVRHSTNQGFISSCNDGARVAKGEILFFLNNDTVVLPGWLSSSVGTFQTFAKVGAVGSKLLFPSGVLQEAGGAIWEDGTGWNVGRGDDPDKPEWNYVREVDYCSGASLAVRADVFRHLEGFDSTYAPAYYEDTDLAFRIRELGFRVLYQPFSRVIHSEGITSGTDLASGTKRFQEVNRHKFVTRWKNTLQGHGRPDPVQAARSNQYGKKRILVIDHYVPMPDRDSGSVRMDRILTILRGMGHYVTFLPQNLVPTQPYTRSLQGRGIEVIHAPFMSRPEDFLKTRGLEFDVVMMSRLSVAEALHTVVKQSCPRAVTLFDTVDLHYLRLERQATALDDERSRREAAEIKIRELTVARSCDAVVVVSPVERNSLLNENPALDVHVVSNIHDVLVSSPSPALRRGMVFLGSFQHPPNVDAVVWFSQLVYPLVRAELGEVPFYVVGADGPAEITRLHGGGIEVLGYVPDLTSLLARTRLTIAPLRFGAGVKGKVNTSMSYGVPVVATPIAIEGMSLSNEVDVLIASPDDPESFARQICRVYQDDELWTRLSKGGLENIRRHFSTERAQEALSQLLESQLDTQTSARAN